MSELGKRVLEARKNANLNRKQLEAETGLPVGFIGNIESGVSKKVQASFIFGIADATGCSARWLATGVDDEPEAQKEKAHEQHMSWAIFKVLESGQSWCPAEVMAMARELAGLRVNS